MKKIGIVVLSIVIVLIIVGLGIKFQRSSAIGIIGGADGPTSVYVNKVQEKDEKKAVVKMVSVDHNPEINDWGMENGKQ